MEKRKKGANGADQIRVLITAGVMLLLAATAISEITSQYRNPGFEIDFPLPKEKLGLSILGDSWGVGVYQETFNYARRVDALEIYGYPDVGVNSSELLSEFLNSSFNYMIEKSDIMALFIGSNDLPKGGLRKADQRVIERFRANIDSMLDYILSNESEILIVLFEIPRNSASDNDAISLMNEYLRIKANNQGIIFASLSEEEMIRNVKGNSRLVEGIGKYHYQFESGKHPGRHGYALLGNYLLEISAEKLRR